MKLLTKSSLYIATLSLFLFFLIGLVFFQVLKNMNISDLNRELTDFRDMFDERIRTDPDFDTRGIAGIDSIAIVEDSLFSGKQEIFGDTLMYDPGSGQFRTYRSYSYQTIVRGVPARVTIFKSTLPGDRLVERVTLMITLMVIVFLGCVFLLNRFVFANLWKDFFEALDRLKEFDTSKEPVVLREQDTEEFNELKKVLEKMTRQLSNDYRELKEYTDHTTHELQTPLAVIKSKTELLMQSDKLGSGEMELIEAINASTNQLARLNSTLALITRIENHQYTSEEPLNAAGLFERHMTMLEEMIGLRKLQVEKRITVPGQNLKMDPGLADILAVNLVKNSIVHNREGGTIVLEDGPGRITLSNDGPPLTFNKEDLFRRFTRGESRGNGFGLGLSLVKKICESYGYEITYSFEEGRHHFTLTF
jgi:signal transduction histidine kinase